MRLKAQQIATEREILICLPKHPFILNLYACFQNKANLYFVLEYCPGGSLKDLIKHRGNFSLSTVRFYSSQILLAL